LLLDETAQEFASLLQVRGELESSHVPLPLLEPVLDGLYLLEQLHFGSLFFGDPGRNFQGKLVSMRAINRV